MLTTDDHTVQFKVYKTVDWQQYWQREGATMNVQNKLTVDDPLTE